MDLNIRLSETKVLSDLFGEFGNRGAAAYCAAAPALLDNLGAEDGRWLAAVNGATKALHELGAGTSAQPQITVLRAKYAKRTAALVNPSALAAKALHELEQITGDPGAQEALASGISPERIAALYPFDICEHLPSIAQHALHGPHVADLAKIIRNANTFVAWDAIAYTSAANVAMMERSSQLAQHYLRNTYGKWNQETSSKYENVVPAWAYLLTFLHVLANMDHDLVSARTKIASQIKRQVAVVRQITDLLATPSA